MTNYLFTHTGVTGDGKYFSCDKQLKHTNHQIMNYLQIISLHILHKFCLQHLSMQLNRTPFKKFPECLK